MILPTLPSPFSLVALETIDSTNDEARRRAEAHAPPFTVVWAEQQTAGRGRRGRQWVSPFGNLHASLLLDPGRPVAEAAQLSFVAGLSLAEALAKLAPAAVIACKWPNDILANGQKVAGMLLEMVGDGRLVLGMGVNVEHAPDPALYPAVSLRQVGATPDSGEVLLAFCRRFGPWFARWQAEGFAPVRAAWLERAHGVGGPVTVRLDAETVEGVFSGLDEFGALILTLASGDTRRILAGDVFFPGQ